MIDCNDDPKLTAEEWAAIDVLASLPPEDREAVEQLAQHAEETG